MYNASLNRCIYIDIYMYMYICIYIYSPSHVHGYRVPNGSMIHSITL